MKMRYPGLTLLAAALCSLPVQAEVTLEAVASGGTEQAALGKLKLQALRTCLQEQMSAEDIRAQARVLRSEIFLKADELVVPGEIAYAQKGNKVEARGTVTVHDEALAEILKKLGLRTVTAAAAPEAENPPVAAGTPEGPAPAASPAAEEVPARLSLAPRDPAEYLKQKGTFAEKLEELKADLRQGLDPNGDIYARGQQQPLVIFALRENDAGLLELLIAKGANLNRPYREYDYPPVSPLYWYLEHFRSDHLNIAMVKLLIEGGADPNWGGGQKTSVLRAMLQAPLPILDYYLSQSPDLKGYPEAARSFLSRRSREADAGHLEIFKKLLARGADPNLAGKREPLIFDAFACGPDYARAVADAGADLKLTDDRGDALVFKALDSGQPELLAIFLDHGVDLTVENHLQKTLLELALDDHADNPDLTRILLDHGADPNHMGSDSTTCPLFTALVADEPVPLVRELLSHGARIDVKNEDELDPLQWALDDGPCSPELIGLLRDHGKGSDFSGSYGAGLLYLALGNEHCPKETVQLLLEGGADPNLVVGDGVTPFLNLFHRPAVEPALLELLLDRGARAATADAAGRTALMMAASGCRECRREVYEKLLSHGVPATARDKDGIDALIMAWRAVNPAAVEALVAGGADVAADLEHTTTVRQGRGREATRETISWREFYRRIGDGDKAGLRAIRDLLKSHL